MIPNEVLIDYLVKERKELSKFHDLDLPLADAHFAKVTQDLCLLAGIPLQELFSRIDKEGI